MVSNTCPAGQLRDFSNNECIDPEECQTSSGQYISGRACLSCHSACPTGCKGPEREDCLFGSCREFHEFFPESSGSSHLAILLISGELKPAWCEPEGWTVILNNKDNDDVSSLEFSNFVNEGINILPRMFLMPLKDISSITSQKNYELRVELTHTDSTQSYDQYGFFSLTPNTFSFNAYFKKQSSPNLGSFDVGQLLNGVAFQALNPGDPPTTTCFSVNGSGSWYTPTCDGLVLLGDSS